jgi:hypothetical protein
VAWLHLGLFSMLAPMEASGNSCPRLASSEREGEALSFAACPRAMYDWDWHGAETLFRKSSAAGERLFDAYVRHVRTLAAMANGTDVWKPGASLSLDVADQSRAGPIGSCAIFICKEIT